MRLTQGWEAKSLKRENITCLGHSSLSLKFLFDIHCDFYEIKHNSKLLTPCLLIHYRYFMTRFSYTFRINSKHRFVEILQTCQGQFFYWPMAWLVSLNTCFNKHMILRYFTHLSVIITSFETYSRPRGQESEERKHNLFSTLTSLLNFYLMFIVISMK